MEITLKEIEVTKLNLQPGEVLFIKTTGPDFSDPKTLQSFRNALQKFLPNNKAFVMWTPDDSTVDFTKVKIETDVQGCGPSSSGKPYCDSCNCGKREAFEKVIPKEPAHVILDAAADKEAKLFGNAELKDKPVSDAEITIGDSDAIEDILSKLQVSKEDQEKALESMGKKDEPKS